jgi:hypothetical protein
MKRTVRLSLGLSFIMLALVLIAPHLASPELVLRFLPKDVYEAGETYTVPDLLCSPCISAYKKGKVENECHGGEKIRWQENLSSKY